MSESIERSNNVKELRLILEALFIKKQKLWDRGKFFDIDEVDNLNHPVDEDRWLASNDNIREASCAANELNIKLVSAIDCYVLDGNVDKFKISCQKAIDDATILNKNRMVFGPFMSAVVGVFNKMAELIGIGEQLITPMEPESPKIVGDYKQNAEQVVSSNLDLDTHTHDKRFGRSR
jgi:hypothetical protein